MKVLVSPLERSLEPPWVTMHRAILLHAEDPGSHHPEESTSHRAPDLFVSHDVDHGRGTANYF
jgi:hypothetical protein